MFRKVDCLLLRVPDLSAALGFYRDKLGLPLAWMRPGQSAGLRLREPGSELVLVEESGGPETDLLVDSVDDACREFAAAGGRCLRGPFEIPVGKVAVVADPWGNELVLIDLTKGRLRTDADGIVVD